MSLSLLVKCIETIEEPAISCSNSIPLIITSALPYLMHNFESPTPLCISVASTLSSVSFFFYDDCFRHSHIELNKYFSWIRM
ncbi:unnamed protein product [Anisakis simplex]|uniref:Uncharacterized protein n=1 Tax=Anisakis simplex TaxID=6269 RepID=A0A3P6QEE6_ANISI|nr:unnamed protein product [Anisakis simplex]